MTDEPRPPGEHVLARYRANRTQGLRAVGGELVLTTQRLRFTPRRAEARRGGTRWERRLGSVTSVAIAPRGWNPFSGSMRRRLVVVDTSGERAYFVVSDVSDVVAAIEAARRA